MRRLPRVRWAPLTVLLAVSAGGFAQAPADEGASPQHSLPALTVVDLIIEQDVSSDVQKNGDRFPLRVGEREIRLRSFAGGSGKDRTKASVGLAATLGFPALLVRGGAYVIAAGTLANAKTAEDLQLPSAASLFENNNS